MIGEALRSKKERREPIVMVTAYDYVTARAAEAAGVDAVLVGDSAATTMLGLATTRGVMVDEMLMLTHAVRRGITVPFVIGDLPFGSYESSDRRAVNTATLFADAGCDAVKMEGAGPTVDRARAVIAAGIPVMGHVGLLPQRLLAGDRPHVQGVTADAALALLEDALALQAAGCCSIVFEATPAAVAALLVPRVQIPVIGIGAGVDTDGQVLVSYDLLGLTEGHTPRFVQQYAHLRETMVAAFTAYSEDVRARRFPTSHHVYGIAATELDDLTRRIGA